MHSETPHILREFDQAFSALRGEVIAMAGQARLNLERAVEGLLSRDLDRCRAVVADDDEVDDAEMRIDRIGMETLVRFHPVASDLRQVITSMKVAANLERISDHAVNIAKRARKMVARPACPEVTFIEPLYALADQQVRDALSAYTDRNAELGQSLQARDKELDKMHKRLIATFSARLEEGGEKAEDFLHLIFVARSLERIGDLAVNIGEDAVYLDSARDIRHEKTRQAQLDEAE
ncbi:MAG: phosphate transport system regulatory protein PhoU [Verrucomicrobia bacterium]|nr:MAG: phosphate transport system regulatory protein PhoU [Verrucomicrobiota bacterium]TAE86757.1 MAG: phosphate transport system regulatory protein PhoU [Verrucomicrobiota bacterium]TAF24483.1 MAG: phosphate transport system regulatory protein PhoU [Verrucomicrobiota bacterium]